MAWRVAVDGAVDAAAAGEDLGVADAAEPFAVLVCSRTGERHVRVRIDEAREHAAALGVELDAVGREVDCLRQFRLAAHPHDDAVLGRQSPAGDGAQTGGRRRGHRHQLGGAAQNEIGGDPPGRRPPIPAPALGMSLLHRSAFPIVCQCCARATAANSPAATVRAAASISGAK